MPNNTVQLIKAKTEDIPVIAQLAKTIWHEHYTSIISMEQINYMLNLMYSDESLKEQMTKKQNDFYLIQHNSKNIGFVAVSKIAEVPHGYFIHKFYLDQTLAGKGSGTLAHNELIKILNPSQLSLTVNRQNFKSINFYFKNGFKIESVADFDIGNGYVMNDFVMVWSK
ncbi:MAG TPA: GNAT family N-acetyltransferase [Bacteroidia bacterium]|jgi:RimJ/RimL family protein N-acetyltransferase|nr:GNAT family N-acetyltransferase [Bacteroidia bacterium]